MFSERAKASLATKINGREGWDVPGSGVRTAPIRTNVYVGEGVICISHCQQSEQKIFFVIKIFCPTTNWPHNSDMLSADPKSHIPFLYQLPQ